MLSLFSIIWSVYPEIFHIGPISVRWYSLLFISGFILGWYIFRWFFRRENIGEKLLDPLLYVLLLSTIIGARLGHCIFYDPNYYFGSIHGFLEIFMPWKGGLASHGGTIGVLIGVLWYSKKYGKQNGFDFIWLLDHLAIAVAFAACFIRLGNLMNSEIYGHATNLPWGVIFSLRGETLPKHPTQIYESLTYLILGISLLSIYKYKLDKLYRGFFIGIFFIVCFGMRFLIEYIKEVQEPFEINMINDYGINMGQLLSIPFIIIGVAFLIYAYTKKKPARAIK